jgi:hypothetical protein
MASHHPLLRPKLLAVIGLLGFGYGIGFALMLAKILILIGLLISLASSAGVIWIYWDDLKSAYRALNNRIPYSGTTAKELVISLLIIAVVTPSAIHLYFHQNSPERQFGKALLAVNGIEPIRLLDNPNNLAFNLLFKNIGNLSADESRLIIWGTIIDHTLSSKEEEEYFNEVERRIDIHGLLTNSIPIETGRSIVLTIPNLSITNDMWKDVLKARLALYFVPGGFSFAWSLASRLPTLARTEHP